MHILFKSAWNIHQERSYTRPQLFKSFNFKMNKIIENMSFSNNNMKLVFINRTIFGK